MEFRHPDGSVTTVLESGMVGDRYNRRAFTGWDRAFIEKPDGSRLVFVTLVAGLWESKPEDMEYPALYRTMELAEDALDDSIYHWIRNREGALHFRLLPTLKAIPMMHVDEFHPVGAINWYTAVCRLAVDPWIPDD